MKVFVAVLVLAMAKASLAANGSLDNCYECEFVNGIGYVADPNNCHVFYQCVQDENGTITETLLCCGNYTAWNQEHLTCDHDGGLCTDPTYLCPVVQPYTDEPCSLYPASDPNYYLQYDAEGILVERPCAVGTVFSAENCTCVHGGNETCSPDPLMYFPFAYHFNDIQCHKVQGTPHGDAFLEQGEDGGYVRLDGDGDFVSFGFLNNYFAWRDIEDFTVSMWFNQDQAGWDNINNFPVEGLFGNGDCQQESSIYLTMGNETQQGGIRTDSGEALFEDFGEDKDARFYVAPEVWCQVAIRYTKTEASLFLNGVVTAVRPISGNIANTFAASTLGLTYFNCEPFFWTGCIDDVLIFDRYVSNEEMDDKVFGRGRTQEGMEAPY